MLAPLLTIASLIFALAVGGGLPLIGAAREARANR